MADAKKCDLCGAFYMPKEKGQRVEKGKKTLVLNEYDEEGYFHREYDFCPKCQEKFEAIVRDFLEREVLKTVSEPLEKIDIFGPGRVG
jgi:methionyl-tRNA synthetase